jgi:hypothetical protein
MRLFFAFFCSRHLFNPLSCLPLFDRTEHRFDDHEFDGDRSGTGASTNRRHGESKGTKQNWSDVLVERVYEGTPPPVIRVSWKSYAMVPAGVSQERTITACFSCAPADRNLSSPMINMECWKSVTGRIISQSPTPLSQLNGPQLAIQNDSADSESMIYCYWHLESAMPTADIRALLPSTDEVLESAVHLALLRLHDYSELEAAGGSWRLFPNRILSVSQR